VKRTILEHCASILFVALIFALVLGYLEYTDQQAEEARTHLVRPYLSLKIDFGDPMQMAMFREALNLYHPENPEANDSLIQAINDYRMAEFTNPAYKTGGEARGLTWAKASTLSWMYLQFIVVYALVMVLTYAGAQSMAVYRFIKMKQNSTSYLATLLRTLKMQRFQRHQHPIAAPFFLLVKAIGKGVAYTILFAPAYVIAYSLKTRFDTDSLLFMIVLGVASNGLLINYANKFYAFLVAESRKGYVETAIVKNLSNSYDWHVPGGLRYGAILQPTKMFSSHVFRHIYMNARHQYLPALKEHASFLISGLIIIEMALNIQGHLGYELLQNILYRRYEVVMVILLAIFLVVKATEILVDVWVYKESRRYENP
jgi:hypothetical protein